MSLLSLFLSHEKRQLLVKNPKREREKRKRRSGNILLLLTCDRILQVRPLNRAPARKYSIFFFFRIIVTWSTLPVYTCLGYDFRFFAFPGNFWLLDANGLITEGRVSTASLEPYVRRFARPSGPGEVEGGAGVEEASDRSCSLVLFTSSGLTFQSGSQFPSRGRLCCPDAKNFIYFVCK